MRVADGHLALDNVNVKPCIITDARENNIFSMADKLWREREKKNHEKREESLMCVRKAVIKIISLSNICESIIWCAIFFAFSAIAPSCSRHFLLFHIFSSLEIRNIIENGQQFYS